MNLLNEKLRAVRVQITMEEKKLEPDKEKLEMLYKEEEDCLKQLKVI